MASPEVHAAAVASAVSRVRREADRALRPPAWQDHRDDGSTIEARPEYRRKHRPTWRSADRDLSGEESVDKRQPRTELPYRERERPHGLERAPTRERWSTTEQDAETGQHRHQKGHEATWNTQRAWGEPSRDEARRVISTELCEAGGKFDVNDGVKFTAGDPSRASVRRSARRVPTWRQGRCIACLCPSPQSEMVLTTVCCVGLSQSDKARDGHEVEPTPHSIPRTVPRSPSPIKVLPAVDSEISPLARLVEVMRKTTRETPEASSSRERESGVEDAEPSAGCAINTPSGTSTKGPIAAGDGSDEEEDNEYRALLKEASVRIAERVSRQNRLFGAQACKSLIASAWFHRRVRMLMLCTNGLGTRNFLVVKKRLKKVVEVTRIQRRRRILHPHEACAGPVREST